MLYFDKQLILNLPDFQFFNPHLEWILTYHWFLHVHAPKDTFESIHFQKSNQIARNQFSEGLLGWVENFLVHPHKNVIRKSKYSKCLRYIKKKKSHLFQLIFIIVVISIITIWTNWCIEIRSIEERHPVRIRLITAEITHEIGLLLALQQASFLFGFE